MKPPKITAYTAELFPATADPDDIMTRLLDHLDSAGLFATGRGWLKAAPRSFAVPFNIEHALWTDPDDKSAVMSERESFQLKGHYYFDDCVMQKPGREYSISYAHSVPVQYSREPQVYKQEIVRQLLQCVPERFEAYVENDDTGALAFVSEIDEETLDDIPADTLDKLCDAIFEVDDEPLFREIRTVYTVNEPQWEVNMFQSHTYYSDIGLELPTAFYDSEESGVIRRYVHGKGIDTHMEDIVTETEGMRFQPEREKATDWNYLCDASNIQGVIGEFTDNSIAGVPYFQIARNIAHLSFRALPGFAANVIEPNPI